MGHAQSNVCKRIQFYIAIRYLEMDKTSGTYSMNGIQIFALLMFWIEIAKLLGSRSTTKMLQRSGNFTVCPRCLDPF